MRRINPSASRSILIFLFLLCTAVVANAQFKASIQGTVTDTTGAIVPNAKVTLTNKETNQTQETTASEDGFYRFSGLAPGLYTVTVEMANFKKRVVDNVKVNAESINGVNVELEAGVITETVTVTAENTGLETEDANIRKTITNREILRLPQVGRDPYELARLTPGIFGDGARGSTGGAVGLPNNSGPGGSNSSIFQTENQVQISANGQRVSANSFQIDGVSVNSQTWGGAAVVTPSQEIVKEVQASSTTYSAEDGRNSGAQISVVTQNGTSQFHGSAFFKYNDPGLNARNKFGTGTRIETKLRQFGGSIGGPIVRDRLFFFFGYEGLRSNSNIPYEAWIETAQYRQLIRNLRPNGVTARVFGAQGIEPRVISLIPQTCAFANIPTPPPATGRTTNCQVVSGGLDIGSPTLSLRQYVPSFGPEGDQSYIGGGFDGIPDIVYAQLANPNSFRGHQYFTRVDYNITDKDVAYFSLNLTPTKNIGNDAAGRSRPISDILSERLNWSASGVYTRTISATALNEARFNISGWGFDEVASNADKNFGIPRIEVEGLPFDRIRFGANRSEGTPGIFKERMIHVRNTFSKVWGNHAFRFGGELLFEINNNSLSGGARPLYSFVRLWNLANDTPIFEAINADPNTGKPSDASRKYRSADYAFFVQDYWKVRPNLSLSLGLRWEYFPPLHDKDGILSNLVFGPRGYIDSKVQVVDQLYNADKNNFGPQFGFSWSPKFLNEKGVIRGGAGIGYNRNAFAILLNARANPPFFARFNICCGITGVGSESWGTPFVGGQILYATGSDNSPFNYPTNPVLGQGIDPVTGVPRAGSVEIYGSGPDQPNAYVYRYSLEGQYELPYKLIATLGYQGSSTHHLTRIVNQNFIYGQTNPGVFAAYFSTPDVNANYNAMIARLNRRFAAGYSFDVVYRWSKSIDTLSNEGPGAQTNQTFPVDNSTERGPSDFDVKHNLVISGLWDLPFFRTRKDWVGKVFGGWQINGILSAHSGFPWTPKIDTGIRTSSGAFFGPIRPIGYFGGVQAGTSNDVFLGNGNFPNLGTNVAVAGTCFVRNNYFIVSANRTNGFPACDGDPNFNLNRPGIGRNVFRGPRYSAVDMSLVKRFGLPSMAFIGESAGLELRANFFNIFNQLNLAPFGFFGPSVVLNPNVGATNPQFGKATSGLAGRVIELQVRFSF